MEEITPAGAGERLGPCQQFLHEADDENLDALLVLARDGNDTERKEAFWDLETKGRNQRVLAARDARQEENARRAARGPPPRTRRRRRRVRRRKIRRRSRSDSPCTPGPGQKKKARTGRPMSL